MSFRRLSVVFLACVLAALSCTDGGTGPGEAGSTRLAVRPVYYASGAAFSAAAGEIQRIRLVARDAATEAEVLNRVFTIDPTQEEWRLQLDIPSTVTATSLVVTIELLSLVGELEVVEWSGKAGPFTLTPGKAQQQDVPVYPGPLDNLTVTGLTITDAAATLVEGDSALATAEVQTTGPAAAGIRLIWGSTDTTVLRVGASGMVRAVRPGTADVIVRAGPRADTASVRVRQRPTTMALSPTAAPLTYIGAEATFSARVLDPRGAPIDSVELAWSVADESVAQHVGNGVVRAAGRGTTTLAVELVGNAAIRATAAITVTQVPARMSVAPASVTLDARGATAELAAEVEDAGGHAIADLTVEWSSSDGRVATVSSAGVVTAVNDGAATITARTGSVSATSSVQVTRVARLLEAVAGDGQTGVVGAALPQAPVVRVADANGHGLGGVAVSFAAAQGSVANASAVTDSTGRASAGGWTLGTRAGPQSLEASAAGLSVSFSATAQPAAPAALSATAGDGQTGPVGSTLPVGPAVRVTDSFGNPVAGVTVAFAVGSGGGSVSPASAITDANGDASTSWTLGTTPGAYSVSASAAGLTAVSFSATATVGAPANITAASPTHQSGTVGTAVAEAPTVLVTDAFGNPVGDVAVLFEVSAGAGTVNGGTNASVSTGADGLASAAWQLGTAAGAQSVAATAGELGSVQFTADAGPGALARIGKLAGDAQSGAAGNALPIAPQVLVTDAYDNPLAGVVVTFAIGAGGGSVASPSATSDANGVASAGAWTLGPTAGANELIATAGALEPVTFTATATGAVAAAVLAHEGGGQWAPLGQPVPIAPAVRVQDAAGQPVAGVTVSFTAGGGGTLTGAGAVSDASGIARVGSWALSCNHYSTNTLTAAVTGVGSVTFTATAGTPIGVPSSTAAAFTDGDCKQGVINRPNDLYTFSLTESAEVTIELGPGVLHVYGYDLFRNGTWIAASSGGGTTPSLFTSRQLLPPGDYSLLAWPTDPFVTTFGEYTLTLRVGDPDECGTVYAYPGVSLTRTLSSADCSVDGVPYDGVRAQIPAGTALRFSAADPSNPLRLEAWYGSDLVATTGSAVAAPSLLLTHTGTSSAFYTVQVHAPAAGSYSYAFSMQAAAPPAAAAVHAGDGQSAASGTSVPVLPAVLVTDAQGTPLQGVPVTFAVTGGGGSVTGAQALTGSDGIARVGSWTLGPTAGTNTLSATVQGIATPVAFTATGIIATPTVSLSLGTRTFVGVSFTAPLTVSLNAPAPVGGVVVSVSSGDPTKLSVASPGTVTIAEGATSGTITLSGVAAGSVTLTGTATGYTSGSLSVPVSLRLISLPTTLNVPYGQTASLPIQLAEPAPAGGTVVTLASSDATRVEVQTPTVTIAAGSLTGNATVTGVLPGPATLTASATEYISGSSAATTTANLDIVETSVSLNASFGTSFTVRLRSAGVAVAAPSPGLTVTLTPFDETCATTPATVTIPTGLTQTVVAVSHGGGTTLPCSTRIRATAANIAPDSVTANVALTPGITLSGPITVGTGLQSSASGYLGASNHGGTTVRISSPDATKLLIAPNASTPGAAYLDIPLANGTSSFSYYVQALEAVLDTLQVTATATGFSAGTVTSYIVQPAFDIGGLSTSTMTLTPDDDFYARVGIPYSNLSGLYYTQALRAGSPGATVTFTVTDTTVARLAGASATAATATVTIAALQSNSPTSAGAGGVALRALSAGSVTVTGSMSGFAATTTSSRVVTITAPTITLSASTMGAGLQASGSGYLSASNHGGTTVRVSSPDASRLLIAPNATTPGAAYLDIAVPNGNTGFSYYLQALEGVNDTLLVTATAPGFTDGGTSVPIVPAAYDLAGLNSSTTTQTGDDPVYVRVGVPYSNLSGLYYTQPLRAGSPGLSATLSVADTSLARLVSLTDTAAASGTVAIAALQSNSPTTVAGGGIAVRPRAAGVASVSASIPGLVATAAATRSTTITAPVITVNSTTVGSGLQTSSNGYLGASAHGGVTVRVSSPDPTRLLISPNSTTAGSEYIDIAVPDGTTGFSYYLQAIEGGTDTLQVTASAPLFTSGAGTVRIVNAGIALTGLSSTLTTLSPDDPFQVQVGVPYDDLSGLYYQQALRAGGPAVNATLTSSRPAAQLVTAALTGGTVTVPVLAAGNSPSGGVALRPLTADTTRISASAPGFVTLGTSSRLVTISAPGITIYGATVGSGLQTSSSGSLGASEHAGVTVRITSSNSSVALVSPNATTAGTPYIDVPLAAGNTGFNFHIQGVEGATGTVTITASASGFTDGTTTVDVVTPGYQLAGLNTSANLAQGDDLFSVQVGIPYTNNTGLYYTQNVRAGAQPLEITLASGTPATALLVIGGSAVASGTVAIAPNSASTPSGLALRPVAAGTSTVTASIPGFIAQPNASMTVQVAEASITTTSGVTVGGGLQTTQSVTLSGSQHGGTTVRITSSDPARLLLAPNGTTAGAGEIDVFIANGSSSASFYVQGIEGATGSVPISMTATGFTSASPVVSVVQPAVDLSGLLTSMSATAANDPFTVRVGIPTSGLSGMSTFQQVRAGTSLVITVSSSNPAAGQLVTASATAGSVEVTIPAGATSSPTGAIAFAPLAAGSTAVSASRTGFASVLTSTVNVTVQ